MPLCRHLPLRLAGLGLAALLAPAAHAGVWGSLTDATTGQPFPAESFPQVVLNRCLNAGDTLCSGFTGVVNPGAQGIYRFGTGVVAPGTYQIAGWADAHQVTYSKPFTVAGGETQRVDMALAPMPLAISDVQGCAALEPGGYCTVQYTLANVGAGALALKAWVMASATSDIPAGWSQYEYGDGSRKPVDVHLEAGASTTLSQRLYVGRDMPSGAYTSLSLLVAPADAPQRTLVWTDLPEVLFGSGGSVRLETQPRDRRDAMAALRRPGQVLAGAAPTAGKRTVIHGRVVGSDTHQPLPVDDKPQVQFLRCELPTDDYCRWLQSDPAMLGDDGTFTVDLTGAPTGRYQLHALAGSHYGYEASATIDVPGPVPKLLQLAVPRFAIDLDEVVRCENAAAASCPMTYKLRNTTGRDLSVDVWLYLYGVQTEAQTGQPIYAVGRDGKPHGLPVRLTIPAGQVVDFSQALDFSTLPAGATGWLRLYAGKPGDAAEALSTFAIGNYTMSAAADGSVRVSVVPRPDVIIGARAAPAQ